MAEIKNSCKFVQSNWVAASQIIFSQMRIQLQFFLGFLHRHTLHYVCFVHYAKSTPHKWLHSHNVHLASTQHIKSRKAQMAEHFVSFAQALSEHCTCLYLASVWSTWGVGWGGGCRIKKKRHLSRMAKPFFSSASPQNSSWPALAVKQSCVHIHFVWIFLKEELFTYCRRLLSLLNSLVLEIFMG